MRVVDDHAIRTQGAIRFRSEYHYAVFEYWRSAKVLRFLERNGVLQLGRVLDDGCGGGGMCVSLGEETGLVVGIDLTNRFGAAGVPLAREKQVDTVRFSVADAVALPFADGVFDTVLSHAVIEHVADPRAYLLEIRRVLRTGGRCYLQTQPYLSPSGAHLPRLRIPLPLHLLLGRTVAFRVSRWLAAHAPGMLDVPREGSSFLTTARPGEIKQDDLLHRVTVRSLRQQIAGAGFRVLREDLYPNGLAKRWLPAPLLRSLPSMPFARDVLVTNMEYLLQAE